MKSIQMDSSFSDKAKAVYYRLRPMLKQKHPDAQYVSIEPESGDYIVGKSAIDVMKKSEKKYPSRQFFIAQVHRMSAFLK